MKDYILIVDFGSQFTQLIARRVRECGVYCEISSCYQVTDRFLSTFSGKGIILSGGPESVTNPNSPDVPKTLFTIGVPLLGICYGQQIMVNLLGGLVERATCCEFGRVFIRVTRTCDLFAGVWSPARKEQVWMSHRDQVTVLPTGFQSFAETDSNPFAVIADEIKHFYGVQFHPEVAHTPHGKVLLSNFVIGICKCQAKWTIASFRSQIVKQIQTQVGQKKVVCGLSGGIDSTVTALLVHEAVGQQLTCVVVDHGMMRLGELEEIKSLFQDRFNIHLVYFSAAELFLENLSGVQDSEQKRKIIGNTFITVFEEVARKEGGVEFLAQGTLYPDVIESTSVYNSPSALIKSHHNVGALPTQMNLKLIEPLRTLFKDEVRRLGYELGVPDYIVKRHPFPGPGLAIRLPGQAVTRERLDILRQADALYIEEIRSAGLYDMIWQAFAILLPVRTVGVMGDTRSYEYALVLRAVNSDDGMTADFYPFKQSFLSHIANRIINEVKGINRVIYDITSKPPGTIEWE